MQIKKDRKNLKILSNPILYRLPSSFLNIQMALLLLLLSLGFGIAGYMLLEGYNFIDALYMTAITVSTVGYTEVEPLSPIGEVFTTFYIFANFGIFTYVLAVFTYYVIQGEIFKKMHENWIKAKAVEFFSFITNESKSDIGFEELHFESLPEACQGKSIRELKIRRASGVNIIGYKAPDGHYQVNPEPDTQLLPNSSFIVLGDRNQLEKLKQYFEEYGDQQDT